METNETKRCDRTHTRQIVPTISPRVNPLTYGSAPKGQNLFGGGNVCSGSEFNFSNVTKNRSRGLTDPRCKLILRRASKLRIRDTVSETTPGNLLLPSRINRYQKSRRISRGPPRARFTSTYYIRLSSRRASPHLTFFNLPCSRAIQFSRVIESSIGTKLTSKTVTFEFQARENVFGCARNLPSRRSQNSLLHPANEREKRGGGRRHR